MTYKTGNIIFSIMFLLIGLYFLIFSFDIQNLVTGNDIGPRAFPIIVSIGFVVFSFLCLLSSILQKNFEKIEIGNTAKVFITMGLLTLFVLVINYSNFYIASLIFVPLLMWINGVKSLVNLIVSTILTIGFVFVVFDTLLGVPLP